MNPKNILVRMPNWVGDLVMATPVLTDLRNAFPDAAITAMCREPLCELLRDDEALDELFCFTRFPNQFLRRQQWRSIIAKIERGKFDLALLLTNSFSSAWLCWQGNIPRRIGYVGHFRRFLLTDPVAKPKEKMHQVDLYKYLLQTLGIPKSATKPRLFLSAQENETAMQILVQRGYVPGHTLIGINPGAAYGAAKCWPAERFRALAKELVKEGYVVFFGDGASFTLVKDICKGLPERVINLAGVTSLKELACIIKACDLLVTNDSGPMHIAAAYGTPLIALFGSTDNQVTGPYGRPETVIDKHATCSPCFKRVCPIDFRCMREISVEEVLEKARHILRANGRV